MSRVLGKFFKYFFVDGTELENVGRGLHNKNRLAAIVSEAPKKKEAEPVSLFIQGTPLSQNDTLLPIQSNPAGNHGRQANQGI